VTTLKRTITVGTVTLTLRKNREVFERYEGFTEHARILVSQQPWGAWQGAIVRREGKGGLLTTGDRYWTPEEAGAALLESAESYCKGLKEVLGDLKSEPPKSEEMEGSGAEDSRSNGNDELTP